MRHCNFFQQRSFSERIGQWKIEFVSSWIILYPNKGGWSCCLSLQNFKQFYHLDLSKPTRTTELSNPCVQYQLGGSNRMWTEFHSCILHLIRCYIPCKTIVHTKNKEWWRPLEGSSWELEGLSWERLTKFQCSKQSEERNWECWEDYSHKGDED